MTLEMLLTGVSGGLSNREYLAWRAFYVYRAAQQEVAEKEAKRV